MPESHFGHFKRQMGLIEDHLSRSLFNPLHEFLSRPRKSFRSQMVEAGFELAGGTDRTDEQADLLVRASQAVEALHAGSLIVDDIQDNSEVRRGEPSLHVQIGMPLALNAGNWLYFFASHLILDSSVSDAIKARCMQEMTDALLKAHQGQALDLSIRIRDQLRAEIPHICRQSLEWKAGALVELGLTLGARIAGCEGPRLDALRGLGRELGVTLQMFDDLGNLQVERPTPKHLEDLVLQRPSFIWWILAEEFPDQWDPFLRAIELLPDTESLKNFLIQVPLLQTGRAKALGHQRWIFQNFAKQGGDPTSPAFERIELLAERIANAYQQN